MPVEESIRIRSGQISSDDNLVLFLYILMRDVLTPGKVEEIMGQHVEQSGREAVIDFSNGWLAKHAIDIADRLKNKV